MPPRASAPSRVRERLTVAAFTPTAELHGHVGGVSGAGAGRPRAPAFRRCDRGRGVPRPRAVTRLGVRRRRSHAQVLRAGRHDPRRPARGVGYLPLRRRGRWRATRDRRGPPPLVDRSDAQARVLAPGRVRASVRRGDALRRAPRARPPRVDRALRRHVYPPLGCPPSVDRGRGGGARGAAVRARRRSRDDRVVDRGASRLARGLRRGARALPRASRA